MSSEISGGAPAPAAPSTSEAAPSAAPTPTGGPSESAPSGSFDFSGWNGDRDSLPNEHHSVFDAIQKVNDASKQEANAGKKLQDYLKNQIYQQNQQQPVTQREQPSDDGPLTREQAMSLFKKEESEKKQRQLVENFRTSMLDVVGKPQKYGDATVAFASEGEVDQFRKFVGETLNGGLTATDMLLLFRKDNIFQQIRDAGAKGFERKLSNNRPSNATGNSVETRTSNVPADSGDGNRRKNRAPRTAELLQANNPELYKAIVDGSEKLF
tara:strand:- start:105 stop:908 length:804 start_codon:yes stop_codon:yes gene_type:complete